jgi:hypothetical protein
MKNLGLLLLATMAFGCATQKYGFRPTGTVMTAEAGYPASHYPVPPTSPHGEAFVTSFGTREIDTGGGQRAQLIHIRLAVANHNADTEWNLDPSRQLLVVPGAAPQRPDFMEVDGRTGGDTAVAKGRRKVFDLYYRLPGGARDAGHMGGFDLQWQIDGGHQPIADHTSFTREPYRDYGEAPRAAVAVGGIAPWWAYGYGPGWWGGFGFGAYGPWGYPYPYYGGYGPYVGLGVGYGFGRYGGGGRPYYGGGYGGGGYGRGGGSVRAPVMRGRRP